MTQASLNGECISVYSTVHRMVDAGMLTLVEGHLMKAFSTPAGWRLQRR
ncbi:hypothetical protein ACNKHM_15120 [Shigella sonnei]